MVPAELLLCPQCHTPSLHGKYWLAAHSAFFTTAGPTANNQPHPFHRKPLIRMQHEQYYIGFTKILGTILCDDVLSWEDSGVTKNSTVATAKFGHFHSLSLEKSYKSKLQPANNTAKIWGKGRIEKQDISISTIFLKCCILSGYTVEIYGWVNSLL